MDEKSKPLGEFVTLQRGKTYKGTLVGKPGPVLLGLGSIEPGGGFRLEKFKTYGGDCPEIMTLYPGDMYASLKGATKDGSMIGSVARVPKSIEKGRLTQDTVKLEFHDNDEQLKRHIYWVMRTPQCREYCAGCATGSAQVGLSREDFLAFPIPPMTESRKLLADVFEDLERKIDLNARMSVTLESLARAIFKSWFVDFDPVKVNAGQMPADFCAQTVLSSFPSTFQDSELGPIPEGWHVDRFASHISVTRGLSYKGSGLAADGVPMHNLNSIYEGGGYKHDGIKYYTGEYRDRHEVKPGDLIATNTEQGFEHRLIGCAALVPKRFGGMGIYSHHIYRICMEDASPLSAHYMLRLINSSRWHSWIAGFSNGTTINMLPADALEMPLLVVPPAELVNRFTELATSIADEIEASILESESLKATRDALLPCLLSGDLSDDEFLMEE